MKSTPFETFRTASGHLMSYGDYGDPLGDPLIFFHGSPGSRFEAAQLHDEAYAIGVRLIAPDRSGLGQSEFNPDATILNHAQDALDLADHLGFSQIAAAGYSGGAAPLYALMHIAPERVVQGIDLAGWAPMADVAELRKTMAPLDRAYFRVAKFLPGLFNLTFRFLVRAAQSDDPKKLAQFAVSSMSPADRNWLRDYEHLEEFHADVKESCRQGHAGPAQDAFNMYRPWGFDPRTTQCEVVIFHGEQDRFAHFALADWKANNLERCSLNAFRGVGHIGIVKEFPAALRIAKAHFQTKHAA